MILVFFLVFYFYCLKIILSFQPIPKPARRVEWDYEYENRRAYGKVGDELVSGLFIFVTKIFIFPAIITLRGQIPWETSFSSSNLCSDLIRPPSFHAATRRRVRTRATMNQMGLYLSAIGYANNSAKKYSQHVESTPKCCKNSEYLC